MVTESVPRFSAGIVFLVMLLGTHAICAQDVGARFHWDDARLGLKAKAFGFGWTQIDRFLEANGHQPIGEQPLTAFSFPLEFSVEVDQNSIPIGFVMDFTTAGTFSRRPASNDYTRVRADILSYGAYTTVKIYQRFYLRPYLLYSLDFIKILSFNEVNATNFRYQGSEFSCQPRGITGQIQLGHESKKKRFQYGLEASYQYLTSKRNWQISPGVPSDMPKLESTVMNLGFGAFLYLRIY